jgi:branched-chain amino acid transport system substrate-binding protein
MGAVLRAFVANMEWRWHGLLDFGIGPRGETMDSIVIGCRPKRAALWLFALTAAFVFAVTGFASSSYANAVASSGGGAGVLGPTKRATGSPVVVGFISVGQSQAIDGSNEIPAAKAALSYVNTYLGGIAGHVLKLDTCSTNETPSGATDCVNQMIADHVAAVLFNVSGQGGTIYKGLQDAHIPLFAYGALDASVLTSKTAFVITDGLAALAGPPALLEKSGGKHGVVVVINVPEGVGPVQSIGSVFYKNAGATLTTIPIAPGVADMTPQIQTALNDNPDQVSILGNDTFCISAIKALKTLGYTKQIVAVPACITDATKKALGSQLKGIVQFNSSSTNPTAREVALYNAVMAKYAHGTTKDSNTAGSYGVVLGFARAMSGISGAMTPETVMSTAVAMQVQPLPVAEGLTFQCNQTQVSFSPATCSSGALVTTLDSRGNPTKYKPVDLSAILKV